MSSREVMLNELRYAERLCQRTARLYRHVQTTATVVTVLGGGSALTALSKAAPDWLAVGGAIAAAVFGALMIGIRPADKAATAEADGRRYSALRAKAGSMSDDQLQAALDEAHVGDSAEVESLRDVAYNDVVREVGQDGYAIPLSLRQKLFAAIA